MKSLVSLTSLFLLITLLSLIQRPVAAQDDLITKICKHTPDYQLCVSTLQSAHPGSHETAKGLGLIVLDAAKAKASANLDKIQNLMESNPRLKVPLTKCSRIYNRVLNDHIPQAIEGLTNGDAKSAEDGVSKAARGAEKCEKILSSIGNPPRMLVSMGQFLSNLFAIVMSIIKSWLAGIGKGHGSLGL